MYSKKIVFLLCMSVLMLSCRDESVVKQDGGVKKDQSSGDLRTRDLTKKDIVATDLNLDVTRGDIARKDAKDLEPKGPKKIFDLTIIIKTADIINAGTPDSIELCVNESLCFPLAVEDVSPSVVLGRNATSVIHVRDLDLLETDVKYVELRTKHLEAEDSNAWIPQCVALRFDGQPRYCNNQIDTLIGAGSAKESISWRDPMGLQENCLSCEESVIPQGPIQGAHTQTTAKFWIRSDASRPLKLRVGKRADLSDGIIKFQAVPKSENDYVNQVTIDGLTPGTNYFYRFEVEGGFNTDIFPFKTLGRVGEDKKVELVLGSCASIVDAQPVFERIADQRPKPDLFIFGGDTHYANSYHRDAQSIHWQRMRRSKGQARVMANISTISTWDDHDFVENNSSGTCEGVEEATRSFVDSWANPEVDISKGVYYKYKVGPAEIFMLDCRTHRPFVVDDGNHCDQAIDPPVLDINDGMLGPEQNDWLLSGLEQSTAIFKLVLCGSQWNPEGSVDSWKSFPVAEKYLFSEFERRNISGIVLLDGDVHRSEFADLPRETGYVLSILTASNLARKIRGPGSMICENVERTYRSFCFANPNYMSISIDAEQDPAKLVASVIDEFGAVIGTKTIFDDELRGRGVARKIKVKVKTKDQVNAGTSDPVEICLGQECFPLDTASLTRGGVATFELKDRRLSIASINEVSLHTLSAAGSDNNAWLPTCLEIELNDQVEYCVDAIDTWVGSGNATGEVERWIDSLGLHKSCTRCP